MKRILDPAFKYTDAASTDIRKSIRRRYKELAQEKEEATKLKTERAEKVRVLRK